jgi:hypothetical protein
MPDIATAVKTETILDPVKIDPKHYKVELENEKIRVLRIRFGPNEKSAMHTHPSMVAILLTDHYSRHIYPDGRTEELRGKAGEVRYLEEITHAPENPGDTPFELIAVELKS